MDMARVRAFAVRKSRKWLALIGGFCVVGVASAAMIPQLMIFFDHTGLIGTYNVNGRSNTNNPFFQQLGTNGRTCATCHVASDAFGLSVRHARKVFAATSGRDPLFVDIDGANCPGAARGDAAAHSLVLQNGDFRIALEVPANAEFQIRAVHDPYGCAVMTDPVTGRQTVSVYRRPLPATNLKYLSAVMADGRETIAPLNNPATFAANLATDLEHQALDATLGHAQAAVPPSPAQLAAIAQYESGLYSAQVLDNRAGLLGAAGARGGPLQLSKQPYYPGINDTLGQDPQGRLFNPDAFTIFSSWENGASGPNSSALAKAREAIAAGEAIFNTHPLTISNVRGLNDNPAVAAVLGTSVPVPAFQGTCSTCHDAPNVGDHSAPLPLDIGTSHDPAEESDATIANALAQLTVADVPVYEITGCPDPFSNPANTGAPYVIYTTDPGRALITGRCADVNRIKGPVLHGLAARAPYFHNGMARSLMEVVNFYDQRFQMNLTDKEKSELVAFLNSL
jgi:cytochrome c peroxidase